jgi:hypothetical protein
MLVKPEMVSAALPGLLPVKLFGPLRVTMTQLGDVKELIADDVRNCGLFHREMLMLRLLSEAVVVRLPTEAKFVALLYTLEPLVVTMGASALPTICWGTAFVGSLGT